MFVGGFRWAFDQEEEVYLERLPANIAPIRALCYNLKLTRREQKPDNPLLAVHICVGHPTRRLLQVICVNDSAFYSLSDGVGICLGKNTTIEYILINC